MTEGLALEFERSEGIRKFRLGLSELFAIQTQGRTQMLFFWFSDTQILWTLWLWCLFGRSLWCFSHCCRWTSFILLLTDVAEILLHVRKGPELICRLVATFLKCFLSWQLLSFGQEINKMRNHLPLETESGLWGYSVQMNPDKTLILRSLAVDACKIPAFVVLVTIDYDNRVGEDDGSGSELLSFVSGVTVNKRWKDEVLVLQLYQECSEEIGTTRDRHQHYKTFERSC